MAAAVLQALDRKGPMGNFQTVLSVVVHRISVRALVLLPLVLTCKSRLEVQQMAIVSLRKLVLLLSLSTHTCVIHTQLAV